MSGVYTARKDSKQIVVCSSPSMNKTPMGNSTPSIPYPVKEDLSGSVGVVNSVLFNGDPAFTMASDTSKVTGDAAGTAKGTSSGTTGKKCTPTDSSKMTKVGKNWLVRCGDSFDMNAGNTKGKLTCSSPPSGPEISDEGLMCPAS